jgi:prepilin-type N-terminal cleavage/methylation domain-containing protein
LWCIGPLRSFLEERAQRRRNYATQPQDSMQLTWAGAIRQRHSNTARRSGFSMLEMLIVMIIISVLVGIAIPKMATIIRHERVNRAAQVLVQDLQNGFAVAGRQRAPVRLTFTPSTKTYVFSDRASGTVLQTRVMSTGADYSLTSMSSTANTIDILPNGIGSTSFTVTLTNGDYSRAVFASTAGFVRITPNQ